MELSEVLAHGKDSSISGVDLIQINTTLRMNTKLMGCRITAITQTQTSILSKPQPTPPIIITTETITTSTDISMFL
jgi:hypothetical protein